MKIYIYFTLATILMFGCSIDEGDLTKKKGILIFSLSVDATEVGDLTEVKSVLPEFEPFLDTDLYLIEILEGEEERVVKSYAQYKDMPDEVELERGDYKIRASYGELKAAAFEAPRFEGKSDFIIKEEMNTSLDVISSLANARLTISYSDDFKITYPIHSAMFGTDFTGKDSLFFAQEEKRAGWFQVSETGIDLIGKLTVKAPLEDEQSFGISIPAVKPKDNVNITFNSSPNEQSVVVKVTINDEVVEVPIYVDVPNYMLPVDAPLLKAEGFANGDPIVLSKDDNVPEAKIEMDVPGTIDNCFLTIWRDNKEEEVYDLANLSIEDKTILNNMGLVVPEMFRKKRAILDFNPVIKALPRITDGESNTKTYHYKLVVIDSLINAHTSDPLTLSIKMIPDVAPKIVFIDGFISSELIQVIEGGVVFVDGIKTYPKYEAKIESTTDITVVSLKITDADGNVSIHDLKAGSIPLGITFNENTINYRQAISELRVNPNSIKRQEYELTVQTKFDGQTYEDVKTLILDVAPPIFEIQMSGDDEGNGDAFAKRAVLRAFTQTGDARMLRFQIQQNEQWLAIEGEVQVDGDIAFIVATNLTTETQYIARALYGEHISENIIFTTEGVGTLPNAGFEFWYSEKTDKDGNEITKNRNLVYWDKYFPWSKDEPLSKGWNTLNRKTTQAGATPSKSWFGFPTSPYVGCCYVANSGTIPTTDKKTGEKAAVIRSIGWGQGNSAAGGAPANTDAGLLYLGEYDEKEQKPIYGISFTTRPTAISFYCKYIPKNPNDKFIAEVVVYDGEDREIGRVKLEAGKIDIYEHKKLIIKYNESVGVGKAVKMHILFQSGTCLAKNSTDFNYPSFGNLSNGEFLGSQLYVDDVELIYE